MAQTQFDPHSAVADAASAWSHVAPVMIVPTNEAEFQRLLTVIDEVLTMTRGDMDHPLADLLHVLGTLAHAYEQTHDPDV
jgi:HTH-type transcriptional regulator / antitoxin HigA